METQEAETNGSHELAETSHGHGVRASLNHEEAVERRVSWMLGQYQQWVLTFAPRFILFIILNLVLGTVIFQKYLILKRESWNHQRRRKDIL